jgi:hypothetical protein
MKTRKIMPPTYLLISIVVMIALHFVFPAGESFHFHGIFSASFPLLSV